MSGASADYSDADVLDLIEHLIEALASGPIGDTIKVKADIEWNGTRMRNPVRETTIVGLDLNQVKQTVQAAAVLRGAGRPAPKSWKAQVNDLAKTKSGRASLGVSRETLRRWSSGKQSPSKANRERIAGLSRDRHEGLGAARQKRYLAAAWEAANALTESIMELKSGDVRFRDIDGLEFK